MSNASADRALSPPVELRFQALAGHSNLSTTQRYIEPHAEAQRKIVELV
jgi:hypothetical protein